MVPRPAVERSMGSPFLLRTRLLSNSLPHISARSTCEDGVVEPFQTDGSVTLVGTPYSQRTFRGVVLPLVLLTGQLQHVTNVRPGHLTKQQITQDFGD